MRRNNNIGEDAFGDGRAMIQRPAPDDRIEGRDQGLLWSAPVFTNDVPYLFQVALDGFPAGFDERLEAWLPSVRLRAVLAHPVLPDVEFQEVEADVPLVGFEGVGHRPGVACIPAPGLLRGRAARRYTTGATTATPVVSWLRGTATPLRPRCLP